MAALLHFKFNSQFVVKVEEDKVRKQYFEPEYVAYAEQSIARLTLKNEQSVRFSGWASLEASGLVDIHVRQILTGRTRQDWRARPTVQALHPGV